MWSEFSSSLHAALWRREIRRPNALVALGALERAPVKSRAPSGLRREAWRIADELGWAKTYDAEYVALATLLDARVVTLDARLRRGAGHLGVVVAPAEL
jgi:predicted nucleic acid-binding protein